MIPDPECRYAKYSVDSLCSKIMAGKYCIGSIGKANKADKQYQAKQDKPGMICLPHTFIPFVKNFRFNA